MAKLILAYYQYRIFLFLMTSDDERLLRLLESHIPEGHVSCGTP